MDGKIQDKMELEVQDFQYSNDNGAILFIHAGIGEFGSQLEGTVTDCQLKYTADGVFRKFAFVGFTSEEEAEAARRYFHSTYIGTSLIQVETCRPLGDAAKPRAWSKYAKDSSAYARRQPPPTPAPAAPPKAKNATKSAEVRSDPKWAEFLAAQSGGAVEEAETETGTEQSPVLEQLLQKAANVTEKQGLLVTGLPKKVKKASLKEFVAPVRLKTVFLAQQNSDTAALFTFNRKADLKRVLKRDGEFFGGFKVSISEVSLEGSGREEGEAREEESGEAESATAEKELELVADTGRIFVKNLSYLVSEEDLTACFQKFGEIAEVVIPVDRQTEQSKGYGLVTFVFPEHAVQAFTQLDGTIFKGRMLHLLPGREKPGDEKQQAARNFKDTKAAAQKAHSNSSHNWNALFVGAGAFCRCV